MFDWFKSKMGAQGAAVTAAPELANESSYAGAAVLPRLRHHDFVRLLGNLSG